jgi:hypothetical protein
VSGHRYCSFRSIPKKRLENRESWIENGCGGTRRMNVRLRRSGRGDGSGWRGLGLVEAFYIELLLLLLWTIIRWWRLWLGVEAVD